MSDAQKSETSEALAMTSPASRPVTVSHVFGEITWLLSQSPLHRHFQITDLEWLVMPAIIHQQFYIFRDGEKPVGFAMWAKVNPAAIQKLNKGMIEPEHRLTPAEWVNGNQIWLIDLVAPFANTENKHREIMMADLISGPLKGQEFKLHRTDPASGVRSVVSVAADSAEKLAAAIKTTVGDGGPSVH